MERMYMRKNVVKICIKLVKKYAYVLLCGYYLYCNFTVILYSYASFFLWKPYAIKIMLSPWRIMQELR